MSQSARQRNLFAAEDFSVLYDTFKQSNFFAYDYDTIRNAMVEYIRNNYPENFNDWIRSSEFVSLIELMAFLGHNLAFRTDLAVRENYLSTAERRESVLKIADFLGYTPARSYPATGFLKIKSIKTTQNVFDVSGKSLKNRTINFLDNNSSTSYQNFLLIMNEILSQSNTFGNPFNTDFVNGIKTELYRLNNVRSDRLVFPFRANVNGAQQNFEIYNIDMQDGIISEKAPNPINAFNIIYKNDNQGLASPNTGFFFGFKQGTLQSGDYIADNPISNLALDILQTNINDIDVWVQEIGSNGLVKYDWKKVDRVNGLSEIFNPNSNDKKMFSVTTLDNDSISINFGDGEFAEIPRGTLKIWYRSGNNQTYVLNPDDVGVLNISINYFGSDSNQYTATFTLELDEPVTNAATRESIENIKQKAGRVFSTQDRMITADDYTIYPVTVSSNILKIKSVNRTHSGHSRFIDFNDPTAQYQSVNLMNQDGYVYTENVLKRIAAPIDNNLSNTQIFDTFISDILSDPETINFYYKNYPVVEKTEFEQFNNYVWQQVTTGPNSSSGYFTLTQSNITSVIRTGAASEYSTMRTIKPNAILEFTDSDGNDPIWTRVISVYGDGLGLDDASGFPTGLDNKNRGSIVLNKVIPDDYVLNRAFPSFPTKFSNNEKQNIISSLFDKVSFGLRFDHINTSWSIIDSSNLEIISPSIEDTFSLQNSGNMENSNKDSSWIVRFEYGGDRWNILIRNYRIVFGSENSVRFFDQTSNFKIDAETKKPQLDKVIILSSNSDLTTGLGIKENIELSSYRNYIENSGYVDNRKIILTLADANNDNYPDDPVSFKSFVQNSQIGIGTINDEGNEFTVYDPNSQKYYEGRSGVYFNWIKTADTNVRIDPSKTNIIDTFVITSGYDNIFRNWLAYDRKIQTKPLPPTSSELAQQFSNISNKKSISDTVIYRSGKYKIIFGNMADIEYQATFRVVKSTGTILNDGEIKSLVIENIRTFFNINNWEFGETFYFTELAAYIHRNMSGIISSIVIVPKQESSVFGNLFQLTPEINELFIPDVTLDDIDIVTSFTEQNLRLKGI